MDIRSLNNNAAWNIFRYIGDYLHDAAVVFLLCHACCRRSVAGLSLRTQCIYLTLYVSRYLDLLDHLQNAYLVFHKIYFISTALLALLCFRCWRDTYQKDADTCPALSFALLALCLAPWSAAEDKTMEILWTWSQSLEGFAMVPQYVCSYRNAVSGAPDPWGVSLWVCLMGTYRFFYILNWLFKKSLMQHYWDPHSWFGGFVNLCFFTDYVLFLLFGISCLRRATLTVDDGLHAVGEDLRERFGGCLLSPGQRYLEIAPTQAMEMNSAYAPPTTFGAATE
ncbi:unnamed protein product [Cladocopium goreaui]|uniref:ER lumen protein-retaining receptor n=1 Tax=Cladocopium goreaui TaxID=2562237 RepID=A0A9P1FEP3_9DINO|nr:unnamed protein product [Cladocopium goreaui]